MNRSKAYDDDLAYIHDTGHAGFSLLSAPGLLDLLYKSGIGEELVVDLGCGSGLWALELINAGYKVLGIDISASMIDIARARVPGATFKVGSYLTEELPQCSAVTSLGECFNYLFDDRNSKQELTRLFGRVFDALQPGGVFIFDISEPGYQRGSGPRMRHKEGEDWAIMFEVDEDTENRTLTRRMTTFRKIGELYRRGEEIHQLRLYKGSEMAKELRDLGFRVRIVHGYGQFRFNRAHVGLIARKPLRNSEP
jgi:SAM-dependent methyltransferase